MNFIVESINHLKQTSDIKQQHVMAQQLLNQVGSGALIQYAIENNELYCSLVLEPCRLTSDDLHATSQLLNSLDNQRLQRVVAVVNKLGNQFARAFCESDRTVAVLGQFLVSQEANGWLCSALETSLYGLRRPEIMSCLTQVCQACICRPFYAGNESNQLKARCSLVRCVGSIPAESYQVLFQATQQYIQSFTLETVELMTQVVQHLDLSADHGKAFLAQILRFFNQSAAEIAGLSYEQMKAVVELQCTSAVWAVNKRASSLQLMLEVLESFVAVFIQHDSHYVFLQIMQFLSKFYDQRPLSTLVVLCQQWERPELRWQQEYVLREQIANFGQSYGIEFSEMQRLAKVLPSCNQLVLQRCQYFMSKDPIQTLLSGGQNQSGFFSESSPHFGTQYLLEDYTFTSAVQWQDWFALVKLQAVQLVTKLTTLFPNDAVQFVGAALERLWPTVHQTEELITMNSSTYYAVDVVNSLYEEISTCVVKLTLHENDFQKTRLLDFGAFASMCQIALNSQVEREISHQNIAVYRHITAVSDLIKFLQKFNVQMDKAQQQKKQTVDQNSRVLYEKYRGTLKPIFAQALGTLINSVDFRSIRYAEAEMSGNLYTLLSQDTLAVRRAVCTKLCSFFSSPYVIWMLLTDEKDNLNQNTLQGILTYFDQLFDAQRLTEKEKIDLTTARINLLISLRELNLNAQGQADYLNNTLTSILTKQIEYFQFVSQQLQQNVFCQTFNINLNAPNLPVTHDLIKLQRELKFKLQETGLIVLHILSAFQDEGIQIAVSQIIEVCSSLFVTISRIANSQQKLPPEFVYQCNPFKINLSLQQDQHLQLDVDDPQAFITQDEYQLEWLDSIYELLTIILVKANRSQFVLETALQCPQKLVHYQKILAIQVSKAYDPEMFKLFWQLGTSSLDAYAAADIYTQVPGAINPAVASGLAGAELTHDQLIEQTQQGILCKRTDLSPEQLHQIGYACHIVGLRAWVDLLQKIIYDQKEKKFDTGFVSNYSEDLLIQLLRIAVICEQDQRSLLAILNIFVLLVQTTPVHNPLFAQVLFICYAQNKNQTTLRELIVNILGTVLTENETAGIPTPQAILSLVQLQGQPPDLHQRGDLKNGLVDWLTFLEEQ